jgi:hypothetical protein
MIRENRVDLYADNKPVIQPALNRFKPNDQFKSVRLGLEKKLVKKLIFREKFPPQKDRNL